MMIKLVCFIKTTDVEDDDYQYESFTMNDKQLRIVEMIKGGN